MREVFRLAKGLVVAGMCAGAALSAHAEDKMASLNIVDGGIPAPLTEVAGDVDKGRKAVVNRKQGNCLACHAVSSLDNQPFHGEVGPSLDGVSERYSDAQLRLILVDSKKVFEGSIMPSFYRTDGYKRVAKKFDGKTILSAQQVEDVIAFLKAQ